ncbi:amidohydrolase family protein [Fusibacter sp. 3D3]|uniref:amidohydrolase family protein n=1 Tax=Fusibacter sp. 3D3 TaxID=1048380 RepID=UPI000855146D|nr:amidohydrolase family protein [Fusibacter sp. 3D3]GAU78234.1 hypothetical protein F3D3_2866 [Fusibacter sp. 3D3]
MMKCNDLLMFNGHIISMDDEDSIYAWIVVRDGLIIDLGNDQNYLPYMEASIEVLDLKGMTVLPGFHDSHVHLTQTGLNLMGYYLSGLVEEVMNNVSDETLSDIPVLFWKDIVRLDNSVIRFINSTHEDEFNLTALTEKNRIFNSLMHLLCHISQKCELYIFIKNFHWIDEISFEFIKYFLFKQTKFRGQLFLSSENMLYIEQLETFFEIEKT